jgi:hypothetical protein
LIPREIFGPSRAEFGAETKNFPAVSLSAGKARRGGVPRFPISFHSTGFKALRAPDTPEMEKKYFTQLGESGVTWLPYVFDRLDRSPGPPLSRGRQQQCGTSFL